MPGAQPAGPSNRGRAARFCVARVSGITANLGARPYGGTTTPRCWPERPVSAVLPTRPTRLPKRGAVGGPDSLERRLHARPSGPDPTLRLCVVLRSREEVMGVLVRQTPLRPGRPDVAGISELLGPGADPRANGLALGRVRQLDRLKELASIDDLTGLFNASTCPHRQTELSRLTFSLRVPDLDAFKRANDRHGHLLGADARGSRASAKARACVRPHRHLEVTAAMKFGWCCQRRAGAMPAACARVQQRVAADVLVGAGSGGARDVSVRRRHQHPTGIQPPSLIGTADEAMYWSSGTAATTSGLSCWQGSATRKWGRQSEPVVYEMTERACVRVRRRFRVTSPSTSAREYALACMRVARASSSIVESTR